MYLTPVGLPQGSSLSPFIFILYHADIVENVKAFSTHLFADDLYTLITPPVHRDLHKMMEFINSAGTEVCQNLYNYSIKWKQPINIGKSVVQLFHSQVRKPEVNIRMNNNKLEVVKSFKYLGFTWTDKLSLKPTVDKCLENVQKSYSKLKWLQKNREISSKTLRSCFFAYSFPHFAWLFPFFPLLPKTQQELIKRKYRTGIRLIYRCPHVNGVNLLTYTKEQTLEYYVCKYLGKRLANALTTDLGQSPFYEDLFTWDNISQFIDSTKRKKGNLGVGHYYRLKRVKNMIDEHESDIISWIEFIEHHNAPTNGQ